MELDYRIANCLNYGYPTFCHKEAQIRCSECGKGIYEGEDFYDFFGETVCSDCEFDYVLKNFHKYL